jgi:hypothetical protein
MLATFASVLLLVQHDLDGEVKKLMEGLSHPDIRKRDEASEKLIQLGNRARASLIRWRDHSDPEVRERVRQLLGHAAILPLDEEVRPALQKVQSSKLHDLTEGILELFRRDRAKVKKALDVCVSEGAEPLRFRSKQLVAVLNQKPMGWLRYGIVMADSVVAAGGMIPCVELWINEGTRDFRLPVVPPDVRLERLDAAAQKAEGGAVFVLEGAEEEEDVEKKTFLLPAGGCHAISREDFKDFIRDDASSPGRYRLRSVYSSKDSPSSKEEEVPIWFGSLRSNAVEFTVR